MLDQTLLIFALVLFLLAFFGVPSGRFQLGWLGLAFCVASVLFK